MINPGIIRVARYHSERGKEVLVFLGFIIVVAIFYGCLIPQQSIEHICRGNFADFLRHEIKNYGGKIPVYSIRSQSLKKCRWSCREDSQGVIIKMSAAYFSQVDRFMSCNYGPPQQLQNSPKPFRVYGIKQIGVSVQYGVDDMKQMFVIIIKPQKWF
jgi:hypothetical protein